MELIIYTVVMFVAMVLARIIGFAANLIALPVISVLMPLKTAVAVLSLLIAIGAASQAVLLLRYVNWRQVGHVLLFGLIGAPFGLLALNLLPENLMKIILAFL